MIHQRNQTFAKQSPTLTEFISFGDLAALSAVVNSTSVPAGILRGSAWNLA